MATICKFAGILGGGAHHGIHRCLRAICCPILLLCAVAGGCAPGVNVEIPGFHGRVVDANANPVRDARIQMTSVSHGDVIVTLSSAADGTFNWSEISHIVVYVAGADSVAREFSIVAVKGTQRSPPQKIFGEFRTWWVMFDHRSNNLGDLRLQ